MSRLQILKEKAPIAFSLFIIAMAVSGTNACQEDYDLGSRSSVNTTGTPSITPTQDDGDDDDLVTRTPTPVGTAGVTSTPIITETTEPTETPAVTTTPGVMSNLGSDFLTELSLLSTPKPGQVQKPGELGKAAMNENWLGNAFNNKKKREKRDSTDSDNDGYADWLEDEMGSDPSSASSQPDLITTKLSQRMRGDSDLDGVSDAEERASGWDPLNPDTDGDGKRDGVEAMADGNPNNPEDNIMDSDSDGIPDDFEVRKNTNPVDSDSDGDGMTDDIELITGCDPNNRDTDFDGIYDGTEYLNGGDCHQADLK